MTLGANTRTKTTIERRLNLDRKGDDRNYLEGKKDIHEQDINFQSNVRDIYLSLEKESNYFIINAYNEQGILNPKDLFNNYKNISFEDFPHFIPKIIKFTLGSESFDRLEAMPLT